MIRKCIKSRRVTPKYKAKWSELDATSKLLCLSRHWKIPSKAPHDMTDFFFNCID
jgi:hypothetical protein